MRQALVDPVTIWSTNPATNLTLDNSTNRYLSGGVGNGNWDTNGTWFAIDVPQEADSFQIQLETKIIDRGGFTAATATGTSYLALIALGVPLSLAVATAPVIISTVPGTAGATNARYKGIQLCAACLDPTIQVDIADGSKVSGGPAFIFPSTIPVNNDVCISSFVIGRRTAGGTTPNANVTLPDPMSLSVRGLSKIYLAAGIGMATWNPTSAADVKLDSRLRYQFYSERVQ